MFFLFIFLAIAGLSLYKFFTWNFNHWKELGVAGPKPKVLFGNFPSAITQKKNIGYEIDDVYQEYRAKGHPVVGVFSVRSPQLIILSPELLKDVYIRKFNSFHDNEFSDMIDKESDPLFGRNPFMLTGDEWKEKRAEITPAFSPGRLKALYPLIEDVCQIMTKYINTTSEKSPNNPFDSKELAAKFTTDVVSSCVFNIDAKSFSSQNDQAVVRSMGQKIMNITTLLTVYMIMVQTFPIIKRFYKMPMVSKDVEIFFTKLMKDAVEYRKEHKIDRVDYLEHLIQLKEKKGISDLDMAAHGVTFFIDGFETSSVVLSQIFFELSQNKDIQDKLRKEIKDNFVNGQISFEKLSELPYLEQVYCETLRLYPIAMFLTKKCTAPVELDGLKDHKIKIENGAIILIPVYSIHRDPQNFPDPNKFDPERFSVENGGSKAAEDKGIFIPFGGGPRMCLGRKFANAQIKRAIIEIIYNFELTLNEKTQLPLIMDPKEFLYRAVGGVWIDFKPLN